MSDLPLQLLGYSVDIAEAALERVVLEDRGGAGRVIGEVDRLTRLVDGMGRGHAHSDALLDRDRGPGAQMFPDISHRLQHEAARGAQIDFGLRKAGLHHGIFAQRALGAARHLVARDIDKTVERAARDAASDAGEADLIAGAGAHPIERAALAAFPVELARNRVIRANEEIVQRELVAGGTAQAHRVPDVGPFDVLGAHQHGALLRNAVGFEFGRAVGLEDRAMRAEPAGVTAAGSECPHPGDFISAVAFDCLDLGAGAPGEHRARIVAEDRTRHRQVEIGRRHRATAGLAEAPGGRTVGACDGLDHMEEGNGIGLDPVRRARQQEAEQFRLMQLVEQGWRQTTAALDLVGGGCDRCADRLGARDHAPVTGKVCGIRGQRLHGLTPAGPWPSSPDRL